MLLTIIYHKEYKSLINFRLFLFYIFEMNRRGGEKTMNADYLKALAHQVMIFRTALLANGADEKTADTLTIAYISNCLAIVASA